MAAAPHGGPPTGTRSLIVWGCTSGAGKSWLATALCRAAARRGLRVAPFKAQNMSNNARVVSTPDSGYGEIGTAQYLQALASRVVPGVDMNPVLLKPERDTASQVVLRGVVNVELSRLGWRERSAALAAVAQASFNTLAAAHDFIVVEGAGSPAEINLAADDYVNLGTARWAAARGPTRALLVANIDHGGAFAHLYGTARLLPPDLQPLLHGHVLNQFRGDARLLEPGPEQLLQLTGVPVVAVIPRVDDHGLPDEDGWFDSARRAGAAGWAAAAPSMQRVAIVACPRISNLDEFTPLSRLPGVQLVWARDAADLAGADLVILPGSKQVSGDLQWLRSRGLDGAIRQHAAAGGRVLGICGGLQMLGLSLADPQGFDGVPGTVPGLGLLALHTHYRAAKRVHPGRFVVPALQGPWQLLGGVEWAGYEIRHGVSQPAAGADAGQLVVALYDAAGAAIGWQQGAVLGCYAHGLFESPAALRRLFGSEVPGLDSVFDTLAEHAEAHFRPGVLDRLLGT